nr:hypothetical protein [Saprospiraceae bacterium]
MKKFIPFLVLFITLSSANMAFGQRASGIGFELGVRAAFGPSVLYESNIEDSDNHSFNSIKMGYSFGLAFSTGFDQNNYLIFETMYATGTQDYSFNGYTNLIEGTNTIDWNTLDLYLLYRRSYSGAYFEVGPKMSFVNNVEQSLSGNDAVNLEFFPNVEDHYVDNFMSAVFGFGGYIAGSRAYSLGLGIRLEYALQNFTTDSGKDQGYPLPYDPSYDPGNLRNINVYGTLELKIPIGRIAQIRCGERGFIFGGG